MKKIGTHTTGFDVYGHEGTHTQRKERGVNKSDRSRNCYCVRQWLFDSLVKFHYVYHRTKQHRGWWDHTRGFPKAKRLEQADFIQAKLNTEVEQLHETDLQTSKTYVYLAGNHTNSSTWWDGRHFRGKAHYHNIRSSLWKHISMCKMLGTSVKTLEPSTSQNTNARRLS